MKMMIHRVSNALKNPAIVLAPISRKPIFQRVPDTRQAISQAAGNARFAGQLKPTIVTTVKRIGTAAIKAYITVPPKI